MNEKKHQFKPFVSMDTAMSETTAVSIGLGILFAVIFAASNVYLGLKTGITIAAAIPASILGTGILKAIFKRDSILEANLVASVAAVGESIAGGIIFTLPAIMIWGHDLSMVSIGIITILGGLIGTLFVIPFREYLIVEEHGVLMFPESIAAYEILVNANKGGEGFKTVLKGLGMGGAFKFLSGGLGLWSEGPVWAITKLGTAFGFSAVASLLGVGFIVGTGVAILMFSGALLAWFGFIPLIKFIGAGATTPIFPATQLISEMSAIAIWSNYIRYIGAGAVATGGFISLAKSAPAIISSFKEAIKGLKIEKTAHKIERQHIDTPLTFVGAGAIAVFLIVWLLPLSAGIPKVGFIVSFLVIFFSFFFGVVSARMTGIMGASNNPVSGMTIASLLVIASVIKASGVDPELGKIMAIIAAGVVCISIATSGGVAQSLKHTYLIGGTPKKIEWSMFAGLVVSAFAAGGIVLMLHKAFGLGSADVPAPQAGLMKMLSEGVMTGEIPWTLVIIGVVIAIVINFLGLSILPIALGLYLPIQLSAAILTGALVREVVEMKFKKNLTEQKGRIEKGILLSSGLVAGDALIGILLAVFITLGKDLTTFGRKFGAITTNSTVGFIVFMALAVWIYTQVVSGKASGEQLPE
ncbi:oligopeptide transporter, OPT family [Psychrilyobacter sp.]|uniref:OPT family oligopeptide transporter n=1 Tax=Psychrilyobacter sp. TaxID=2586924 RepID=UPI00301AE145